jgi:hypothetical protein
MPEPVTIPISRFEYRSDFAKPDIGLLIDRKTLVQAIFESLLPWGLNIDGVEALTKGKTSEQGVKFMLPEKKTTLFFGADHFTYANDDSDWNAAPEIIEILSTFRSVLTECGKVAFSGQSTSVLLHAQPAAKTYLDLLKPFLPEALQAVRSDKVKTGAIFLKWDDGGRVTIDGSGRLANAVFVSFEQHFAANVDLSEIAVSIREMEESIFKVLDIEEAQ